MWRHTKLGFLLRADLSNSRLSGLLRCMMFLPSALVTTTTFSRSVELDQGIASFQIPRQKLETALIEFSRQANVQVVVDPKAGADAAEAPSLYGRLSARAALERLLNNTGLTYSSIGKTVSITNATKSNSESGIDEIDTSHPNSAASIAYLDGASESDKLDDATRNHRESRAAYAANNTDQQRIDEVLVTAQKRSELLQDVPVPVSVLSGVQLAQQNQVSIQDYYSKIPGLNVTSNGYQGSTILSIRGLSTGFASNPTVGVTIDDVPYGSSTNLAGGNVMPDLDASELQRIEVLRGPQGTYYGTSTLGGLIKFVTIDPSSDRISGRVQAGASGVYHGAEAGYNVRGSINVPLSDTLAIRASGYTRTDPGYVDDPTHGEQGVNKVDIFGGRLAAIWKPSDTITAKVNALYQRTHGDGTPQVDLNAGLTQDRLLGTGTFTREIQDYSATVIAKFGDLELTSLTGYNRNKSIDSSDWSAIFGGAANFVFPGTNGASLLVDWVNGKFTQEVRLSASLGSRIDWLLGGFYSNEQAHPTQAALGVDPATGREVGLLFLAALPNSYREIAGFTDLTFHLTDIFDVQLGARESAIKQTFSLNWSGPLGVFNADVPKSPASANSFTYLVTPTFKISPNLMVYARAASGFRAGGINANAGAGNPPQYDPDRTRTYEVGAKGSVLDHALAFDASIYYIDWSDIQQLLVNPATSIGYTANSGNAKSQGVELSVEAKPLDGTHISSSIAYSDAVLTEGFPSSSTGYGNRGDRLPYGSRWSGSLSVNQEFRLTGDLLGSVGASLSYIGDRVGEFQVRSTTDPSAPAFRRAFLLGYAKVDLNAELRRNAWTVDLFVQNVADRRGVLDGGTDTIPTPSFIYIQPRTFGINVARTF